MFVTHRACSLLCFTLYRAVMIQDGYAKHRLSFTDVMTAANVKYHDIDSVLSFDDIVIRLVPISLFSSQ